MIKIRRFTFLFLSFLLCGSYIAVSQDTPPAGASVITLTVDDSGQSIMLFLNGPEEGTPIWIETAPGIYQKKTIGKFFSDVQFTPNPEYNIVKFHGDIVYFGYLYAMTGIKEIDITGSKVITKLDCEGNDVTSIKATNVPTLEDIHCSKNPSNKEGIYIRELDLTGCTGLKKLYMGWCGAQTLKIDDCTLLEELSVFKNEIPRIDLSLYPNLRVLDCGGNPVSELKTESCKNLAGLTITGCKELASVNCEGLAQLQFLDCMFSSLTNLNVKGCSSLKTLKCSNNNLKVLDLADCSALETLNCNHNLELDQIDLSNKPNLKKVYASSMALYSLNLQDCAKLEELWVKANYILELDVSKCLNLKELMVEGNRMQELDLTGLNKLSLVQIDMNEFSINSLNSLFETLHDVIMPKGKTLIINQNPGTPYCKTSIAKEKGWSVDVEGNAVDNPYEGGLEAYGSNGKIFLQGVPQTVYVYDLNGTEVAAVEMRAEKESIELPNGHYLVRGAKETVKVSVW